MDILFPSTNHIESMDLHDCSYNLETLPVPSTEFQLRSIVNIMVRAAAVIKEEMDRARESVEYPTEEFSQQLEKFFEAMLQLKIKLVYAIKLDEFIMLIKNTILGELVDVEKDILDKRIAEHDNVIKFPGSKVK